MIKFNRDIISEQRKIKNINEILKYIYDMPQFSGTAYVHSRGFQAGGALVIDTQISSDINYLLSYITKLAMQKIIRNTQMYYSDCKEWWAQINMVSNRISVTVIQEENKIDAIQYKRDINLGKQQFRISINFIPKQFYDVEKSTEYYRLLQITPEMLFQTLNEYYKKHKKNTINFISQYLYGKYSIMSTDDIVDIQFSDNRIIVWCNGKTPRSKRTKINRVYIVGDDKVVLYSSSNIPQDFVAFRKYTCPYKDIKDFQSFMLHIQNKTDKYINGVLDDVIVKRILGEILVQGLFGVDVEYRSRVISQRLTYNKTKRGIQVHISSINDKSSDSIMVNKILPAIRFFGVYFIVRSISNILIECNSEFTVKDSIYISNAVLSTNQMTIDSLNINGKCCFMAKKVILNCDIQLQKDDKTTLSIESNQLIRNGYNTENVDIDKL